MKRTLWLVLSLLLTHAAVGEDMDLRNRAEQLMNRALIASRITTPLNVRTEVTFSATGQDGVATAGSYIRIRSADNALREDFSLGDYGMSRIQEEGKVAMHGQWVDIPYVLRKVTEFVPYLPIRFESADVITGINESKMNGKAAVCVQFVTVKGEDRSPGDVCLAKDNGTVIEWHDRDGSFEAPEYHSVKEALLPSHFVYREGEKLLIDARVRWTLLDARPDDAFVVPEDWQHAFYCKSYMMPVPQSAPQPVARGGIDAPVITVELRAHVRPDGTVSSAEVLKPVREDLDSEAVALVKTWTYQAGSCEGTKQNFSVDATVRFQGR
jgi:TonB family protein